MSHIDTRFRQDQHKLCLTVELTWPQWIDGLRKTATRMQTSREHTCWVKSALFCSGAKGWQKPANMHSDPGGSMDSRSHFPSDMHSIAERGLSSFLNAIAESSPGTDLEVASDCWIRAMETTTWNPEEGAEKFVRRVTIKALATGSHRAS
jgi:hypothetical protein